MTTSFGTTLATHIVHAEWLSYNLNSRDICILDARSFEFYAENHIPNAHSVNINDFRYQAEGIEGLLVPPQRFADLAGVLGIDKNTLVVVYDDYHGLVASRLAWSFLRYGHHHVALLDGGWEAWEAGAYPVTMTPSVLPSPRHFVPQLQDAVFADYAYVQAHINTATTALLDVRSTTEYAKGYIPNAVQWDWQNGTSDTRLFGNLDHLRAELLGLGITPDKEIITYCQSGVRASHTFFLLRQLGFKQVRMYDGSWAEWSAKIGV